MEVKIIQNQNCPTKMGFVNLMFLVNILTLSLDFVLIMFMNKG